MCGIAAIINTTENAPKISVDVLHNMANILSGRGPDATGIWMSPDSRVGLVNRRLATQDARPVANQPCWSHDRTVVCVLNGEIYNHRRLRSELEAAGCIFATNNDTEVLANAFRLWGPDMMSRLEGQFAFVCVDIRSGESFAARDSHGICPLFYMEQNGQLLIASTPLSIFEQPDLSRSLDIQAVTDFFIQDSTGEERTFFAGMNHLRAGFSLICRPGRRPQRTKFYDIGEDYFAPEEGISEDCWIERIRNTLETAIHECMLGDKQVGIYLSGGIDSLSILALLKRLQPDLSIQTFSAGFADALSGELIGEAQFARSMADHFGTVHHEVVMTQEEVVAEIGKFDLPPSGIIDSVVKRLAQTASAAGVNVALSGEGADEMFFGYDHYMAAVGYLKPEFAWLSDRFQLRGEYFNALDRKTATLTDLFLGGGANIDYDNDRTQVFGPGAEGTRLIRDQIRGLANELSSSDGAAPADIDRQLIYIDYAQKVPENLLRRAEGPSMGEGVEMRFPFLSDKLVRLMYRLPIAQRIGDGTTKYMLRKVMAGILPEAALNRPKSPFGLPAARREHFKGAGLDFQKPAFKNLFNKNFKALESAVLDGAYTRERLFRPEFVSRLLNAQKDEETCSFNVFLWKLWNFSVWYEKHLA